MIPTILRNALQDEVCTTTPLGEPAEAVSAAIVDEALDTAKAAATDPTLVVPRGSVGEGNELVFEAGATAMPRLKNVRLLNSGGEGYVFMAEIHLKTEASPNISRHTVGHAIVKAPLMILEPTHEGDVLRLKDARNWLEQEFEAWTRLRHLPYVPDRVATYRLPRARLVAAVEKQRPGCKVHDEVCSNGDGLTLLLTVLPATSADEGSLEVPFALHRVIKERNTEDKECSGRSMTNRRGIRNWIVLARSLALALIGMHRQGVPHGDLKPANIVLRELYGWWREVTLIDFGTAASIQLNSRGFHGTPEYYPPRVLRTGDIQNVSFYHVDLVALGLMLCELLLDRRDVEATQRDKHFSLQLTKLVSAHGLQEDAEKEIVESFKSAYPRVKAIHHLVEAIAAANEPRSRALRLCNRYLLSSYPAKPVSAEDARLRSLEYLRHFLQELEILNTHHRDGALLSAAEGEIAPPRSLYDYLSTAVSSSDAEIFCEAAARYAMKGDDTDDLDIKSAIAELRKGYGRVAKERFYNIIDATVSGIAKPTHSDFVRMLRLHGAVVTIRDEEYDQTIESARQVEEWTLRGGADALWGRDPGWNESVRENLLWWLDLIESKARYHRSPSSFKLENLPRRLLKTPAEQLGTRERSWLAALRYLSRLWGSQAELSEAELRGLPYLIENAWSSVELAFGALVLARAQMRSKAHWREIVTSILVSLNHAKSKRLPHEFAGTLYVVAKWIRDDIGGPGAARHGHEVDRDRCLGLAGRLAALAAELYSILRVPRRAQEAMNIAFDCYKLSCIREHAIEALRMLSYGRNSRKLASGGDPPGRDDWSLIEQVSAKWTRLSVPGESNVSGDAIVEDPGEFLASVFYNRWAEGIRRLLGYRISIEISAEVREELFSACRRKPGSVFLDVGCGNGVDIETVIEAVDGLRVIGTEFVTALFEGARERLRDRDGVRLYQSSTASLHAHGDLGGVVPDTVLLKDSLCYVANKHKVLGWLGQRMSSGSILIIVEPVCAREPIAALDRRQPSGPAPTKAGGRGRRMTLAEWRRLTEGTFMVGLETVRGYEELLARSGFAVLRRISLTEHVRGRLDVASDRLRRYEHLEDHDEAFCARSRKIIGAFAEPMGRGQLGWAAWVAVRG